MPRGVPGSGKAKFQTGNKNKNTELKQIQRLIDRLVQKELRARIRKVLG